MPTSQRSHALDRAIQNLKIPSYVRGYEMGFRSRIIDWLSKDCLRKDARCVYGLEQDLSLIAAGRIRKLNGYMDEKIKLPLSRCL